MVIHSRFHEETVEEAVPWFPVEVNAQRMIKKGRVLTGT
jgi:hypothetical protein